MSLNSQLSYSSALEICGHVGNDVIRGKLNQPETADYSSKYAYRMPECTVDSLRKVAIYTSILNLRIVLGLRAVQKRKVGGLP